MNGPTDQKVERVDGVSEWKNPWTPGNAAGLGLGALTLLGNAAERAAAVASFQSDQPNTPRVLCLSYRHHAAGLNLHRAGPPIHTHTHTPTYSLLYQT